MKVYTIGFTKKSASEFFETLKLNSVSRVIDVRLNNVSQLAGFSKKDDLEYFLKTICDIEYIHLPELAPTKMILDKYKKHKGSWEVYESEFLELIAKREIENTVPRSLVENGCLLCSEKTSHRCHRRLVLEYLDSKWNTQLNVRNL